MKNELEKSGKRVLVAHYADLLKYICRTFFGWDGAKDENGRKILQYVGTDVIRSEAPDYWVDFIMSILKYFGDNWDYVLIPDTRFPNEIKKLKDDNYDVVHIRVVRKNFTSPLTEEQQQHPSETALDNVEPDFYMINDGTIDDFEDTVTKWVKENITYEQV